MSSHGIVGINLNGFVLLCTSRKASAPTLFRIHPTSIRGHYRDSKHPNSTFLLDPFAIVLLLGGSQVGDLRGL